MSDVVLPSCTIGCTFGWAYSHGAEQGRHQPTCSGSDRPDAGLTGDVVQRGNVGRDVVELADDASGALDHASALVREVAGRSIDEGYAELVLELRDAAGDVRLHREQGSSRGGEAAVVGDGDERGELTDIHLEKRYLLS